MAHWIGLQTQDETVIATLDNDAMRSYCAGVVAHGVCRDARTLKPGSGVVIGAPGFGISHHYLQEHS
ncbi:MAG TPA: hypothetical protein VIS76_00345 [Pseudomonadales bacterium]